MTKTVLLRIDDRFLHGQIGRRWVPEVNAGVIIVANDRIHNRRDEQKLMDLVTPIGVSTYFLPIEEVAIKLKDIDDNKNAIIIVENPKDALTLIEENIDIDSINVGNMRNTGSKKKLNNTVYVDNDDIDNLKKIIKAEKNLDIRAIPTDKSIEADFLFE